MSMVWLLDRVTCYSPPNLAPETPRAVNIYLTDISSDIVFDGSPPRPFHPARYRAEMFFY